MNASKLVDEDLEERLKFLLTFLTMTQKDIELAGDVYKPQVERVNSGQEFDGWEVHADAKLLIRALLGQLDAIGHLMRQIVVQRAAKGLPALTNKELAKLSERKYDRESDLLLAEPSRFLSTLDSFRLALKYFPLVFAEDHEVDFGEPGWHSLTQLANARNRFTHPERLEDLVPIDALIHLQPALLWSQTTISNMMLMTQRATGGPSSPSLPTKNIRTNRVSRFKKAEEILDEEFYSQVKSSGARSIAYVSEMMKRMQSDTNRAWDLYSRRIGEINPRDFVNKPLQSDEGLQFASRNLLRAFFSQVEGTISFARFMLEAAARRGEIQLTEKERASFVSGGVDDQLWATTAAWSREFGTGATLNRNSKGWQLFAKAIEWRNGVTHPQTLLDFLLLPSIQTDILKLPSWFFSDPMKALEFDVNK